MARSGGPTSPDGGHAPARNCPPSIDPATSACRLANSGGGLRSAPFGLRSLTGSPRTAGMAAQCIRSLAWICEAAAARPLQRAFGLVPRWSDGRLTSGLPSLGQAYLTDSALEHIAVDADATAYCARVDHAPGTGRAQRHVAGYFPNHLEPHLGPLRWTTAGRLSYHVYLAQRRLRALLSAASQAAGTTRNRPAAERCLPRRSAKP